MIVPFAMWLAAQDEPEAPAEPPPVEAPPPPEPPRATRFGDTGQIVITADSEIGAAYDQFDDTEQHLLVMRLAPGIDWFVVRRLSIGLDVDVSYTSRRTSSRSESKSWLFGGGVRVGYAIPLGARVSFYPRVGTGIASAHASRSADSFGGPQPTTTSDTGKAIGWINLFTPFVFEPAPNFIIGAGPSLYHQFGDAPTTGIAAPAHTTIGARVVVGGTIGGEPDADAPPARATEPAKLGSAGQVVVTGESGASLSYLFRTNAHRLEMNLTPGADWFVADHLSVGAAMTIDFVTEKDTNRTPDAVTITLGPRIGVDIPLASNVSLYPRASLFFGDEHVGSTGGAIVTTSIYAPFLVHVAEHFFAGFGPYVGRDLARKGPLASHGGSNLVVGGWL